MMHANKIVLVQLVVVVACLAGLALSAAVDQQRPQAELEEPARNPLCQLVCEACKGVAQRAKEGIPMAKEQLLALCKNCGAEVNVKKCERAIEQAVARIEKETPEQICTDLGFCSKSHFLNLLGL